jgi:hypothetical protein
VSFTNQGAINVSNGDTVTINSTAWSNTGSFNVSGGTLNLGSSFTLAQLGTVNHTGGIVALTGTLDNTGGTLNVGTGSALATLTLNSNGTIKNGTIYDAGSGLVFSGGTLDGVTYQGVLDMSAASSSVIVKDGITLTGAGGTGNGTINLTGQSSALYARGTETLDNATFNIGNTSTDTLYNYDVDGPSVLTLGSHLTVNQTGSNASFSGYYSRVGSGIVNAGTIKAGFNGGNFSISYTSFTNQGTINVSNGDTVYINSTAWSNSGSFNVSGGTLNLGSSFTLAQLGMVNHTGGIVALAGTLDDTGGTLNVGTGSALATLTLNSNGTIKNGTIHDTGAGLVFSGGTLDGVTYQGVLDMSTASSSAIVKDGITLTGAGGIGNGTINLTGQNVYLYASDTETLDNATFNIGNTNTDTLYNYDVNGPSILTLGSHLTVNQTGSNASFSGYYSRVGSGIVNAGTINAGFNGGNFSISYTSFTNQGTINVTNGDTVYINATPWSNTSSGVLNVSGGIVSITSPSWSNAGLFTVSAGTLRFDSNLTFAQLGAINHTGGTVAFTSTLDDTAATLNVGAGSALGTLTLAPSGSIKNGTIHDAGSGLVFSGGTLDGVTYQGVLDMSSTSSSVYVKDGITLTGAGGTGNGLINLTGQSSALYARGTETLDNAALNIGNVSADTLYNYDVDGPSVLTLGSHLTVNQTGNSANFSGYYNQAGSGIVNAGTINAGFNGGNFTIGDVSFTNQGTINVSNGDRFNINSTAFANTSGGAVIVSGGIGSISSSSWSNSGSLIVSGGTLNLGSSFSLAQLGTVNHTAGTLALTGTLNDTGATLNIGSGSALGTITLTSSGTIKSGIIHDVGSGLVFSGGTLDGVTYQGVMDMSAASASAIVKNGITLTGLIGSGNGIINLTGQSGVLYAQGTETIDNATLNLGNANIDTVYNDDRNGIAGLTLGSHLIVNQTGSNAGFAGYFNRAGSGIVNAGTINANFSGGNFSIGDASFTNQGTINVSNGDTISINSTAWSNSGSFNLSGGTLNLGGSFTLTQLGTLNRTAGTLALTGILNDNGVTLNIGSGSALGTLTLASTGTIRNGIIHDTGSSFAFSGGALDGVTYQGALDMSAASASAIVKNGITLTGLTGSGNGTINLTGQSGTLFAQGTESLDNATLNLGNVNTDTLYNDDRNGIAVLTLGSHLTVNQTGSNASFSGYFNRAGSGIVNAGTINANFNGGKFTISDASFTNNGSIIVSNGDTLAIFAALNGSGNISIAGHSTVEIGGSAAVTQTVVFADANSNLLKIDSPTTFSSTITNLRIGDTIDLANTQVQSAAINGGLLTIKTTGNQTLSYNIFGSLAGNDVVVRSDGAGGSDLALSPIGSLWGAFSYPLAGAPGVHIGNPLVSVNGNLLAYFDGVTPTGWTPGGPNTVANYESSLDSFFLPEPIGSVLTPIVIAGPNTVSSPNSRYMILPLVNNVPENLLFTITQDQSGNNIITKTSFNADVVGVPQLQSSQIESGLVGKNYSVGSSFRNDATGNLANYDVAWDQYDSTAHTYSVSFQIFNADGTASSAVVTPINLAGVADAGSLSLNATPAWQFRSGGGSYELAEAQNDPVTNVDFIQFQNYSLAGVAGATFAIQSDLTHYAAGATNSINQQDGIFPNLVGGSALRFAQFSAATGSEYGVAWTETVSDINGTHNQVEFALDKPGTGIVSRSTFQVSGPQQVGLIVNAVTDQALLIYGDNSATHLIGYDANGNQLASVTDSTSQVFSTYFALPDGRVGIQYDQLQADNVTTDPLVKVYDFRTTGVNINDSALTDGKSKQVAGTEFNDIFVGENGVNNAYEFVGGLGSGSIPTDRFTGGTGGWNVAILPDAESNYSIITSNGVTTLTNINDPQHAGSLTVTNVQALAFNPSIDPTQNAGTLEAAGGTLDILGPIPGGSEPATIDSGSTLELATPDAGSVTFATASGTLKLDNSKSFTGTVSGLALGNYIDLTDIAFGNSTSLGYAPNTGNTGGTLSATDGGGHTANIALLGNYIASSFVASSDGHGGTLITDPPPVGQLNLSQPHV